MDLKEKELLLKDLSARLPYDPIVYVDENLPRLKLGAATRVWEYVAVDKPCKPYLRPMSSMTEEERKEFESLGWRIDEMDGSTPWNHNSYNVFDGVDWLNKKMFAYRTIDGKDMFELGLVLQAPEGMYN